LQHGHPEVAPVFGDRGTCVTFNAQPKQILRCAQDDTSKTKSDGKQFFGNLLDFGPAPRAQFLAGPGMFGSGAARTVEGLWFNNAGAYAAGFHLVIGMWFE
jgi:hypothetical protein